VTASRVIEPIDVFEDRHLSLSAGVPGVSPDQLCLDGFEERFNGGVVIAISLATHGCPEPMLAQDLLIIVRTILAATISMMNAALGSARKAMAIFTSPASFDCSRPILLPERVLRAKHAGRSRAENANPRSQPDKANLHASRCR
jgi:hypothetical protein